MPNEFNVVAFVWSSVLDGGLEGFTSWSFGCGILNSRGMVKWEVKE